MTDVSSLARKIAAKPISKWKTAMNKLNLTQGTNKKITGSATAAMVDVPSHDDGGNDCDRGTMQANPMHSKSDKNSTVAKSKGTKSEEDQIEIILDPATGRRYSCNYITGNSEWLDEELPTAGQLKGARKSFRKILDKEHGEFFQDVESGDTAWDVPGDGVLVHEHAIYDYVATNSDEISMQEGDKIVFLELVDDDTDDSGWVMGRNERTGEVGLCHLSYL